MKRLSYVCRFFSAAQFRSFSSGGEWCQISRELWVVAELDVVRLFAVRHVISESAFRGAWQIHYLQFADGFRYRGGFRSMEADSSAESQATNFCGLSCMESHSWAVSVRRDDEPGPLS